MENQYNLYLQFFFFFKISFKYTEWIVNYLRYNYLLLGHYFPLPKSLSSYKNQTDFLKNKMSFSWFNHEYQYLTDLCMYEPSAFILRIRILTNSQDLFKRMFPEAVILASFLQQLSFYAELGEILWYRMLFKQQKYLQP